MVLLLRLGVGGASLSLENYPCAFREFFLPTPRLSKGTVGTLSPEPL